MTILPTTTEITFSHIILLIILWTLFNYLTHFKQLNYLYIKILFFQTTTLLLLLITLRNCALN